jgi:hypothetical protein
VRRPRSAAPSVVALLATLALGACGSSNDDSAEDFAGERRVVAAAVEDLQEAGRKGDAGKICRELLASAVTTRLNRGADDCEAAVKRQIEDADTFELTVESVQITGTRATARIKSTGGEDDKDRFDTLVLVKERSSWRVADLAG